MIDDARREELEVIGRAAGYELGHMMAAFVTSTLESFADGWRDTQSTDADPDKEIEPPDIKTQIEDCRECWCNICANIEICENHWMGEVSDGTLPAPCTGCKNGMRGMPLEIPRSCAEYEPCDGYNKG